MRNKIDTEHHHLHYAVDRLRSIVAGGPEATSLNRWLHVMTVELVALRRFLVAHFRHEESGGYFEEILARHPELTARVHYLAEEHQVIKDALDAVIDICRVRVDPEQISRLTRELLARISDHERAERTLVQDSFLRDLGAGD